MRNPKEKQKIHVFVFAPCSIYFTRRSATFEFPVKLSRVNDHRAGHWCADVFGRSAMKYPLSSLRITVTQLLIFDRASPSKTTLNWFFTLRYYEIPKTNFLLLKEEENKFFWFAQIIWRTVSEHNWLVSFFLFPTAELFVPPTALCPPPRTLVQALARWTFLLV